MAFSYVRMRVYSNAGLAVFIITVYVNCVLCTASNANITQSVGSGSEGAMTMTIQSTRKKLKQLRKWKDVHKAEVSLVQCLAKYIKRPCPVVMARADLMEATNTTKASKDARQTVSKAIERSQQTPKLISWIMETEDSSVANSPSLSDWQHGALEAYQLMSELMMEFVVKPMTPIWENQLVRCGSDYVGMKFWSWVDDAPE